VNDEMSRSTIIALNPFVIWLTSCVIRWSLHSTHTVFQKKIITPHALRAQHKETKIYDINIMLRTDQLPSE